MAKNYNNKILTNSTGQHKIKSDVSVSWHNLGNIDFKNSQTSFMKVLAQSINIKMKSFSCC